MQRLLEGVAPDRSDPQEPLEADPGGVIEQVYGELGLEFEARREGLNRQVANLSDYRKNRYDLDPDLKARIYERLRPAFERYEYPSRLNESAERVSDTVQTTR